MAKKRKKRRSAASNKQDYPGWVWMLFGLAIGLSVAFAIYVRDRQPGIVSPPATARVESAVDDNGETPATEPETEPGESRFTFYNVLPNYEVVIPEHELDVTADTEPRAIVKPGLYVLQAGSFSRYEDADRRRAELALQGIESNIQRVTIDDRSYHRVRIGPTGDLEGLNLLRSRWRAARIDALRIRLGD